MGCLVRKLMGLVSTVLGIALIGYVVAYAQFRKDKVEVWEKDGASYLIFPKDSLGLYYLYRPLSYLDQKITGTGAHLGEHQ